MQGQKVTSGAIWGSASCSRTLWHARPTGAGIRTRDLITKGPALPPWDKAVPDVIQYWHSYFGMLNHLLIIWIFNMIRLGADKMNLLTLSTISHDAAGTFQDLPGFFLCCCSIKFSHNPHSGTTSNNLKEHNPKVGMILYQYFVIIWCNSFQ